MEARCVAFLTRQLAAMATTRLPNKAADYGTLPTTDERAVKSHAETASFVSRLFFSYATPLMETGNQRPLETSDLWEHVRDNRVDKAHAEFAAAVAHADGRLVRAIVRAYGVRVALCGVGSLLGLASTLFAPIVLHHVVDAFSADVVDLDDLTVWLAAFFSLRVVATLVSAHVAFQLSQLTIRLVVSIRAMLFEKALRRESRHKAGEGQATADLTNLFTADIDNIFYATSQVHGIWTLPIQIGGIVYLLYNVLGGAAFAGLGVIFLSIIVGGVIAALSGQAFQQLMRQKDARMKVVKEVFGAIQIVKFNGWEIKFAEKILGLRELELKSVWRTLFLSAISSFVLWGSPLLVSICSFGVYTLIMEQQLTAAKVFTAMALFASLRAPLMMLPTVIAQFIQAGVALGRMQEFLATTEYNSTNVIRDGSLHPEDVVIDVQHASFGWGNGQTVLENVNLRIKKGDLAVVHGPVGAGKSSLCSALLGEMEKISGSVFVRGRVAYYSQQTWIQNLSIRDNILFGKPFDAVFYQRVLDSCGLVTDLEQFPAGDLTEIGQNGVNLSGGQKARLCLARACYSNADLYILDSPLAAVDALVQTEIFSKCICGLLQDKTIVLVTHTPDVIASDAANCKVAISNGQVTSDRREPSKSRSALIRGVAHQEQEPSESSPQAIRAVDPVRLVEDENRETGRVSKDVYLRYFEALGGSTSCVILLLVLCSWQASQVASDLWLSHWTGQKNGVYDGPETRYNMLVYSALCLACAFLVLARSMTSAIVGIRAARYLFESMTRSLLHAPLRFFDANPIGRIVNRYGDDIGQIDFLLPMCVSGVLTISIFLIGQLGTAIATVRFLGILVLPLVYVYLRTTSFYISPSRDISRLRKVSDSPLLSYVTGSEDGSQTIRAFGPDYVADVTVHARRLIDANSRVFFVQSVFAEWFELRIQLVGCGVLIVIVSALVYLHDILSPGIIGLAFTYTLNVQYQLIQPVGILSYLENSMVSPERVLEYASIPPEGGDRLLQIQPSPQWPHQGTIQFDNVDFSYKKGMPAVLKGVSFSIKNNEKIGIVGRTGAGKSSLTMALFRINELNSGRILIDGVDIASMPLQSLRSHLSIIPQAPVLFKGPLRSYVDPFDEYSDSDIWEAFEKVEMKEQIAALEGQLSYELSENGENFSVGERQMLCMARAMLTKSRIVVMDEATASIDHATEKKLQHMINRDFQEATVLTIAHRLATVLDSDRIMVLSDGRVVEFDSPLNLVKKEHGVFYELTKEGGVLDTIMKSNN